MTRTPPTAMPQETQSSRQNGTTPVNNTRTASPDLATAPSGVKSDNLSRPTRASPPPLTDQHTPAPVNASVVLPRKRKATPHRTVRTDGSLHKIVYARIHSLIEYVGIVRGDGPTVHIASAVGPVEVVYPGSGRTLSFNILPECLRIANKRNHIHKLIAPSVYEVLLFMTELEAVRQNHLQPIIRFASRN